MCFVCFVFSEMDEGSEGAVLHEQTPDHSGGQQPPAAGASHTYSIPEKKTDSPNHTCPNVDILNPRKTRLTLTAIPKNRELKKRNSFFFRQICALLTKKKRIYLFQFHIFLYFREG